MNAEGSVLVLAMTLMVTVVFGPEARTRFGAILIALAMVAVAAAVGHHWLR